MSCFENRAEACSCGPWGETGAKCLQKAVNGIMAGKSQLRQTKCLVTLNIWICLCMIVIFFLRWIWASAHVRCFTHLLMYLKCTWKYQAPPYPPPKKIWYCLCIKLKLACCRNPAWESFYGWGFYFNDLFISMLARVNCFDAIGVSSSCTWETTTTGPCP